MNYDKKSQDFLRDGWTIFELSSRELVDEVRSALLGMLRQQYQNLTKLDYYHEFVQDDEEHIAVQKQLFDLYVSSGYGPAIIKRDVEFFRNLIGPDLHVQARPYLRIVRPGKPQDNVNIHRDTHYGGTPFEVSVHVPFTDVGLLGSLGVIGGSHVEPDGAYPYERVMNTKVERGSVRHQLGFTYAPKNMRPSDIAKVQPTGTTLGQALVFCLSLVHGQVVNRGEITRFSSDIRVVSSHAPIECTRIKTSGYCQPLCRSALTSAAEAYYEADAAFSRKS